MRLAVQRRVQARPWRGRRKPRRARARRAPRFVAPVALLTITMVVFGTFRFSSAVQDGLEIALHRSHRLCTACQAPAGHGSSKLLVPVLFGAGLVVVVWPLVRGVRLDTRLARPHGQVACATRRRDARARPHSPTQPLTLARPPYQYERGRDEYSHCFQMFGVDGGGGGGGARPCLCSGTRPGSRDRAPAGVSSCKLQPRQFRIQLNPGSLLVTNCV